MNMLKNRFALGCLLLFGAGELHAQTNYAWNSTASATITTTTAWSPNGTPGSGDNIITPTTATPGNLVFSAGSASVTNWTYSPNTAVVWQVTSSATAASAFSISGTLTIDDGGLGGNTDELIYKDSSAADALALTIGTLNLNNGRLYLGGPSYVIHNLTVSGLTTIGSDTTATATSRLDLSLDGVAGTAANFQGGVAFGTGSTASFAEDFYFNTGATSQSASVGFLSGGNKYAIVEGLSTAGISTLILNGTTGSSGDTGTNSFAGIIQDTTSGTIVTAVQKTGNDTQIFTGANTYTGGTIISGGNLQLANVSATSATGTGTVSLSGAIGATLSGTGFSTGLLTVTAGGRIAPGVNTTIADGSTRTNFGVAGTLTLGSAAGLTLTNANLDFDLSNSHAAGNDLVATGGALTLGTLAVNINELNGTLETGTLYTLISGAASVSGFNTANITTTFLNGTSYTPMYSLQGNSLDVSFTMTAVPEPSTWAAGVFCMGMAMLALRHRLARA